MVTKKEIAGALYLSCVESYFLAWLGRYYDVGKLYGGSFIPLGKVFDDFNRGATYQNYCDIPRMQDIAEEYGIVTHRFIKCGAEDAINILKNQKENGLYLIRVNTAFFTGFKRSSWREDHYICADKDLNWINEYPLSEGTFGEERFKEVYDGALCAYELNDLTAAPPELACTGFINQSIPENLPRDLGALESAIGILRVSRKRLEKFYGDNAAVKSLLRDEINKTDRIYFDVHLRRLKKENGMKPDSRAAREELCGKIREIADIENKITETIKNG